MDASIIPCTACTFKLLCDYSHECRCLLTAEAQHYCNRVCNPETPTCRPVPTAAHESVQSLVHAAAEVRKQPELKSVYEAYHATAISVFFALNGFVPTLTQEADQTAVSYHNTDNHPKLIFDFGNLIIQHFITSRQAHDLDRAISLMDNAVSIARSDNPFRPQIFLTLATLLTSRYQLSELTGDLDTAIDRLTESLNTPIDNIPVRVQTLRKLADYLRRRYERKPTTGDINRAIELMDQAEQLVSDPHAERDQTVQFLQTLLLLRHKDTRSRLDQDRAVSISEELVQRSPENVAHSLFLANILQLRGWYYRQEVDLRRSIDLLDKLTDTGTLDSPDLLISQVNAFTSLYTLSNDIEHIKKAIEMGRLGIKTTPTDHDRRLDMISALSESLEELFKATRDTNALAESIQLVEAILSEETLNEEQRAEWTASYARKVDVGFCKSGEIENLNSGIERCNQLLQTKPDSFPKDHSMHWRLGSLLLTRYEHHRALKDLENAISNLEAASNALPPGNAVRLWIRASLSSCYLYRSYRPDSESRDADAKKFMEMIPQILAEAPPNYPIRAEMAILILEALMHISEPGNETDHVRLRKHIADVEAALQLFAIDSKERLLALNILSRSRLYKFLEFGREDVHELNQSIEQLKPALAKWEANPHHGAFDFGDLGDVLLCRTIFAHKPEWADINEAVNSYRKCFEDSTGPTFDRILAAKVGAVVLGCMGRWKAGAELLEQAIHYFPQLSSRSLRRSDQQNALSGLDGIASTAAALALNANWKYYDVLKLLELGRGLIPSLLLETRLDVATTDPEIRDLLLRLQEAQAKLNILDSSDSMENKTSHWIAESRSRYEEDRTIREIIHQIRANPKMKGFLSPPTTDELMMAVRDDTVIVVNADHFRSDAFLIDKKNGIRHVRLENLKFTDIKKWTRDLRLQRPIIDLDMLEWLWMDIAKPVLDALDFGYPLQNGTLPRVWWILTGSISHFPIHAAGMHHTQSATVIDRVMSSYSPYLKVFVHDRLRTQQEALRSHTGKALLIGMQKTVHPSLAFNDLPFAAEEVEKVESLCPSLGLEPARPQELHCDVVLSQLPRCIMYHFAGHGQTNTRNPSGSGLLLDDGLLTVAQLRENRHRRNGQDPFLGYLSACLTGANDVDGLVDEGIHLINACQLAGTRHVIGTLWQVFDETCVKVAERFYQGLGDEGMNDESVCSGLHQALVALRDEWMSDIFKDSSGVSASREVTFEEEASCRENDEWDDLRGVAGGRRKKQPVRRLVKAPWVPYVHYGP